MESYDDKLSKFQLLFDVNPCGSFDKDNPRENCRCEVKSLN